jgi:hypothetical protein
MPYVPESEYSDLLNKILKYEAVEDASRAVVLAAWTDRFGRLHGHESITALEVALNNLPKPT